MPLTELGATAIEAAGSLAGSVTSGLFGANQAKKNRAFQERMYEKQLRDNRENWEMVNRYNLPSAALQRLIDAGLNPLLYYTGAAGTASGLSGNIASSSAPSAPAPGQMPFANPFVNLGKNAAAMRNLEAQKRLIETERSTKSAEGLKFEADAKKAIEEAKAIRAEGFKAFYEGRKAKHEGDYLERSLEDRIKWNQLQNQFEEALTKSEQAKVDLIRSEQRKNEAAIDNIYNEIYNRDRLTTAQIDQIRNEVEQLIKRTAHECALMDQEARKAFAEAYILEIEGAIKSMPEWQAAKLKEQVEATRMAILKGDEQFIANRMAEYIWDTMPKYDNDSMSYRKWLQNYVTPTTQSIGNLLGGTGAAAIGLLK